MWTFFLKCLDVAVDSEPTSSPADCSLFGRKMFIWVKTISCRVHLPSQSAVTLSVDSLGVYCTVQFLYYSITLPIS